MGEKKKEKTLDNGQLAFESYKMILEWIDRRQQPAQLEFYNDKPEYWRHAKEAVFMLYQNLRRLVGPLPRLHDLLDRAAAKGVPPYKFEGNPTEFECVGILRYRGVEVPIYDDDYGMSWFGVYEGRTIQVDSFGGETDWYFELDRIIDKIYD